MANGWSLEGSLAAGGLRVKALDCQATPLVIEARGTSDQGSELGLELVKQAVLNRRSDRELVMEKSNLGESNIPVLMIYPNSPQPLPLVFVVHGYTAHKEANLREGLRIAEAGYFVVLPDARMHGERRPADFEQRFAKERFIASFFQVVTETAGDISELIDTLTSDSRIDPTKIGMTGISMGGFTTFMATTLEKRIKAAAPLIGSPDWFVLADVFEGPGADPKVEAEIARLDPVKNYTKFLPTALLAQNGTIDQIVPPQGTRNLTELLVDLYHKEGIPERYRYIEYPEVAHEVVDEMIDQVISWFEQFLS